MLRIDRENKSFLSLENLTLTAASITERGDLQEYIWHSPEPFFRELSEDLFLIGKEVMPSSDVQDRIDLLALDREGNAVVVELKRGNHKLQLLQAISYAAMISKWTAEEFSQLIDTDRQEELANYLEVDADDINRGQRIILVAEAFDFSVLASAEWLNEHFSVDIQCCRITLARDPGGAEYLACSIVYPAPELAKEAKPRGGVGKRGRAKTKWTDWDSALLDITNPAIVEFFMSEVSGGAEAYLPRRILRYRIDGKRRWHVSARRKVAYTWQVGRFDGDVEFWRRELHQKDTVKPVKDGEALRFFLETPDDFASFKRAVKSDLLNTEWLEGPIEGGDGEASDD